VCSRVFAPPCWLWLIEVFKGAPWPRWTRGATRTSRFLGSSRSNRSGQGTVPGMKLRTSLPRSSMPSGRGAPSKPTACRCDSSACTADVCGPAGRRTVSPTRTTPALAFPPGRGSSTWSTPQLPSGQRTATLAEDANAVEGLVPCDRGAGLAGYLDVLPRGDDQGADGRALGRDVTVRPGGGVTALVHRDAEEP
jgi:hypothetical protein